MKRCEGEGHKLLVGVSLQHANSSQEWKVQRLVQRFLKKEGVISNISFDKIVFLDHTAFGKMAARVARSEKRTE